jgi:hypothetical protein
VNVGGHIAVARELHPDEPAVWLGAALPDLATMGRHRLLGSTTNDAVALGISIHHRTDEVFHRHRHFTTAMARLRTSLTAIGVERGPSRAIAHVGPELLIDGWLLDDDGVRRAVGAALDHISELDPAALGPLVLAEHRSRWLAHLERLPGRGMPHDYDDPHAVASRLHRILAGRPRLSFPGTLVDDVGHRLADEQQSIVDTVDSMVDDLVTELSS